MKKESRQRTLVHVVNFPDFSQTKTAAQLFPSLSDHALREAHSSLMSGENETLRMSVGAVSIDNNPIWELIRRKKKVTRI
ncbi:hypothetical protein CEXT_25271 [Caerostris extrusa]|uniref:Uncharacterized protein n=1 Tax=Caerostris extrusa TaxID=172846 RepID=A0AAV4MVE3_CAEEX|nr:hypothetical protein CEXT_25271 [Caerostris extrusa]